MAVVVHSPFVWGAMAVFGMGFLFPYNSFINALDYYSAVYDRKGYKPEFTITTVNIVASLVVMVVNVGWGVSTVRLATRIRLGFALFILALVLVLLVTWLEASGGLNLLDSYRVLLVAVAIVSLASGIQQASMYGYSAMMNYTEPMMIGESVCGFFVSLDRIATKAAFGATGKTLAARNATSVFFGISLFFLLGCTALYEIVHRTPFSRGFTDARAVVGEATTRRVEKQPLLSAERGPQGGGGGGAINNAQRGAPKSMWELAKDNSYYLSAIFLTYFVTLAVFPGGLFHIRKYSIRADWLPILLVATFNLCDLVGKLIPMAWSRLTACPPEDIQRSPRWLFGLAAVRLLLVGALFGVIQWSVADRSLLTDAAAFAVPLMLGLSNGYLGLVLFGEASKHAREEDLEMVGNMMTLSLLLGLSFGSTSALVSQYIKT